MPPSTSSSPQTPPVLGPCPGESPFLGVHHVTFVTQDMDRTVRFWTDVLGIPVVATRGNTSDEPYRHYVFDLGRGAFALFVERKDARFRSVVPTGEREVPEGRFRRVALLVDGRDDVIAVQERLVQSGVDVSKLQEREDWTSVSFTDPNGITVEVACPGVDYQEAWEREFRDPEPVPALKERLGLPPREAT